MMLMKNRSLVLIYTIVLFAAAAVLGITACSGTGISEFYGIMENNPKLSMLLALLSVPVPMAIVLKTFDFGEKDGAGKAIASFIILLIGEILLMAAISAAMPAIEFSMYMGGWLRKIAAAAYAALIAIPSVYVLVRIVSDGIFGFGGFIEKVASVIAALNQYTIDLAGEQIRLAFGQAQKEVEDLHQRTKEGIETARRNGKQIGQRKGAQLHVKKAAVAKEIIKKHSRAFGGSLSDADCQRLANISRNTFYK